MARELLHPAQFTIRVANEVKEEFMASAAAQNIDSMTWVRQAIYEKLEREKEGGGYVTKKEVREMIEAAVASVMTGGVYHQTSGSGDNNMRFG